MDQKQMKQCVHLIALFMLHIAANHFGACQVSEDSLVTDGDANPPGFVPFLPPTPYLPNNGEYMESDYDYADDTLSAEDRAPHMTLTDDVITSCAQRRQCQERSAQRNLSLSEQNCFCDAQCVLYDDCCADVQHAAHDLSIDAPRLQPFVISCLRNDAIDTQAPFLLVDSCPRDTRDGYLLEMCDSYSARDAFLQIPVSGRSSRVLYKNVYCALCNAERDVDFWDVVYRCLVPPNAAFTGNSFDEKRALDETLRGSHACSRSFTHASHTARNCKANVKSRCDRHWRDRRIKRQCRANFGTSYVYVQGQHIYKNQYCAICNNVNMSQISCIDDVTTTPRLNTPDIYTFSVRLNINSAEAAVSRSVQGLNYQDKGVSKTLLLRQCQHKHVFDPYHNMCRLIGCGQSETFENGECFSRLHVNDVFDTTTTPQQAVETDDVTTQHAITTGVQKRRRNRNRKKNNRRAKSSPAAPLSAAVTAAAQQPAFLSCGTVTYSYDAYTTFSNGSIQLLENQQIYAMGDYIKKATGDVTVCAVEMTQNPADIAGESTHTISMFGFSNYQNLASIITTLVSLISLLTVFVVYIIFAQLRDIAGKSLMSLVFALFCAQLATMIATQRITSSLFCHIIGASMHFFWLATFMWMSVLAMDICMTYTRARPNDETSYRFCCYSLYAWSMALLITGASVALDFLDVIPTPYKPHYASDVCWISQKEALFYLLALPLGAVLILNFILFLITIVSICTQVFSSKMAEHRSQALGLFIVYVLLGFVMGCTWITAFAATLLPYNALWYAFTALNALLGVMILVAFVCNRHVYDLMAALNKPPQRKGATTGGYYACPNGSSRPSNLRHHAPFDDTTTFRLELESQETSI